MSITSIDFEKCFECLTANRPFPWQTRLYGHFLKGDATPALDLPTGLGKTATIAVWLLALPKNGSQLLPKTGYPNARRLTAYLLISTPTLEAWARTVTWVSVSTH